MVDAVPQYLDPALAATPPRPPGFRAGDYPQQANAAGLVYWTIGVSTRAIRQPFGDAVGAPLHYEYDLCLTNLVAVDCRGDPEHPDDRSVVQIAQSNPPQAGLVFPTWFWFDWVRSTVSATAYYNKSLATKAPSAYCGQQVRAGVERPALGVTGLASNGGSYHTALTDVVLAAPGSATKGTLDCPLIAEDGSAAAPQPLRVPCWVGRWGFKGVTGQVLAAGTSTQNLGFILKLKPLSLPFTENAAALKIEFAAQTAEYGCEVYGACSYTMAFVQNSATYSDMNFSAGGPPYPCKVYGDRCWKNLDLGAYIQVFLTPMGDTWQAVVAISQMRAERQAAGGRYVLYSNFSPGFYHQKSGVSLTKLADDVSATVVGIGTTTTVTKNLFGGEASLTVEIAVSAIGKVTKCEARITRNASVTNLGPGWHDKFVKL